jgi:hypothetical protein
LWKPEVEDVDEDVMEIDLGEEPQEATKFLAMVRFYSGKKYNAKGLFEEMKVAWGLLSMIPAKVLGNNKFLLEFDFTLVRDRVVDGGLWRHRGDALLIVPYDWLSSPSSIVMNTICLWARFYDHSDVLRKEEHANHLGLRLGQVVRVDLSYPNYVRVRVMFPLASALVALTEVHIRGRSDMVVMIKYENILYFCFIYGRIGHSDRECPDGEVAAGEFGFGMEFHASPPKRMREVKVQTRLGAAHFLNFEGTQ